MKKTKMKWLALLLAVSMVFGQSEISYAVEAATEQSISDNDEVSVSDNEETPEEPEVGEDDESDVADDATEVTEDNAEVTEEVVDASEEAAEEAEEGVGTAEEETDAVKEASDTEAGIEIAGIESALEKFGFTEMKLSTEMFAEKTQMAEVVSSMKGLNPGENYKSNELVAFAESETLAQEIAESYNGVLTEYEYGVAVITIETDVIDALKAAADMNVSLPAVYPNLVYSINTVDGEDGQLKEYVEETSEEAEEEQMEEDEKSGIALPCEVENLYATAPNDTYFEKQWYHDTVGTVEAWNASKGKDVVVAVVDTGIDYNHEDLKANVYDHISTLQYSSTGNDDNGHGTHCAGIIAAVSGNRVGVAGVAPQAKVLGVKVLDEDGYGATSDIVQGVIAATNYNVDVISMSLGGICWDRAFQNAINAAFAKGIVIIAAAGNEATSQKSYPAAYDNVVAVAATHTYNGLTDFSNYGKWVDIAAPGYNILSTVPTSFTDPYLTYEADGYAYMSGTSMACPLVAGIAALMISNNDAMKNASTKADANKIANTLINSATYRGAYTYYVTDNIWYYSLADAEATVYAVDETIIDTPTIQFSSGIKEKNVVDSGYEEYFTLSCTNKHAKIYYTINGTKPTVKTGRLYTGKIYMPRSGKTKIQAIAVVGNRTSKVFSATYQFVAKATELYSTCNATMTVLPGKTIQLNVGIEPYFVSNKKLDWSCNDTTGMIKVSSAGKVSCNKKATAGTTATVTAKTKDGSDLSYAFKIKVAASGVEQLTLNVTKLNMSYYADEITMKAADGSKYVSEFQLKPQTTGAQTTQYIYKSSNNRVASVSTDGWIYAWGKGKATITVMTNDGSGKKATCVVNVVTPVYDIHGYTNTGFSENSSNIPIGTGCSIKINPVVNYGGYYYLDTPSNKKLIWSSDNANVTVKNGKVTCSKNATVGSTAKITATAADGFGTSVTYQFKVTDAIKSIEAMYYTGEKKFIFTQGNTYTGEKYMVTTAKGGSSMNVESIIGAYAMDYLNNPAYVGLTLKTDKNTKNYYPYFTVSVSNRDTAYRFADYSTGYDTIIVGTKPGTTKIVYTALDGSNKKFTVNWKTVERIK